ncbi:MAG TPA: hypothetical protein DIV41_06795 [Ruminococcaceae bacterium]|nr:hypothetical protein [Oscillospiraceae bacterium]
MNGKSIRKIRTGKVRLTENAPAYVFFGEDICEPKRFPPRQRGQRGSQSPKKGGTAREFFPRPFIWGGDFIFLKEYMRWN